MSERGRERERECVCEEEGVYVLAHSAVATARHVGEIAIVPVRESE